jgi:hypothetical protein
MIEFDLVRSFLETGNNRLVHRSNSRRRKRAVNVENKYPPNLFYGSGAGQLWQQKSRRNQQQGTFPPALVSSCI